LDRRQRGGGDAVIARWWIVSLLTVVALAGAIGFARYPAKSASLTLNVGTAHVEGKSEKILTDAKGLALYYLTSDTSTSSACTAACALTWPPLLSASAPTASSSLKSKVSVVHTANGAQVSFNDHLLYRFAADTKPGQVGGNDKKGPRGGEWYVATPGLAKSQTSGTPGGGYKGYQ
jgi:predicted lipoprotein with Yx(FWY)xxD motif